MATSTYFDQVQQLYIAYFGRPADTVGLAFWAAQVDAANGNVGAVVTGFASSTESNALYSGVSTTQKVNAIYLNLFNRQPEAAGLAYWAAQIDSGTVTQAQAAYQIQSSAGAGDAAAVANKLAAAKAFTAQIDTTAEVAGYVGANAATSARAFLAQVDSTAYGLNLGTTGASAALAVASGVRTVAPAAPDAPAAPSFLTTTTGSVLSFGGTVTGDITVAWSTLVGSSIATFSRGGLTATPITFGVAPNSVTLATTDSLAGTVATLVGLTVNGTGTVKLTDTAVALAGKTFAANTSTDVLTVSTSAAATTSLTGLTGFETIHLAGGTANITVANGAGTKVDTSAPVKVILGTGGQTFIGSAGNDIVNGGTGNDIISAGSGNNTLTGGGGNNTFNISGTDTISDLHTGDIINVLATGSFDITDVAAFTATALTANAGSFTINAANGGTVIDMSLATGPNGFTLYGSIGNDVIIGSAKGDTISGGTGTNTLTGGLGSDTFSSVGTDSITDLTTGDVLSVANIGNVTATNVSAFVATAATTNAGIARLNSSTAGSSIDLSLATGVNGFTVVGGAGNDVIKGSVKADVFTGGLGINSFVFDASSFASANSTSLSTTGLDTITDFKAAGATNKIDFTSALIIATHTATAVSGTASITAAGLASFDAADVSLSQRLDAIASAMGTDAIGTSVLFNFASDSYVFVVGDATAGVQSGDALIKLTGVTSAVGLTIAGGDITAAA